MNLIKVNEFGFTSKNINAWLTQQRQLEQLMYGKPKTKIMQTTEKKVPTNQKIPNKTVEHPGGEYIQLSSNGRSLFWLWYIHRYDRITYDEHVALGTQFKEKSKRLVDIQLGFATHYNEHRIIFREQRWTKAVMEGSLGMKAMESGISEDTFSFMCISTGHNVILCDDIKYMYLNPHAKPRSTIIVKKETGPIYKVYYCRDYKRANDVYDVEKKRIEKSLVKVKRFSKPLNSLSAYKKAELMGMCETYELPTKNKFDIAFNKAELYEMLESYLCNTKKIGVNFIRE